ncbi:hypothetical protein [Acinetobacter guillouiae]|uniref:hypothetical protein n=1 Tax=Acinetobacter guillouiae TaxID=106649 RepID=UPI0002D0A962|nr:hypothetical protein [Acinetobacter guillouiae]ENU59642.1 hypothetical protein F981_01740 [Acinetobacter guillouiae CIP 63.46]KAB0627875.1 hypothetical protein F7P82_07845 [Acinetobacter guillouiae]
MIKKIMLTLILMLGSTPLFAGENVSNRKIIDIGCHTWDDTCFITLSGPPFGSNENCTDRPINELRFPSSTTNGKRTYASLLSAFLAKKTVDIYISGCGPGGWPTLAYFHIH